jgi:hypothetical protein
MRRWPRWQLASNYHAWTVTDNEAAIEARRLSVENAPKGGKVKAEKNRPRNEQMAHEFQRRKVLSRKSDSSLKAEIGRAHGLKPRAAINAINKGLEILCSIRGKMHE